MDSDLRSLKIGCDLAQNLSERKPLRNPSNLENRRLKCE